MPRRPAPQTDPVAALKTYFRARQAARRGLCLLNAAQYGAAAEAFQEATSLNPTSATLSASLAACYRAGGEASDAAAALRDAAAKQPDHAVLAIRLALTLWTDDRGDEAIAVMREAIERTPDDAELQFQLGVLLASSSEHEEAELRFAQACAIDKGHVDAMVHLALCYGARQESAAAVRTLHKALQRRPDDARVGLLLSQAARAAGAAGEPVQLRLIMPADVESNDPEAIATLCELVLDDADFVDALLAAPQGAADREIYLLLLETVRHVIARQGEHADLHYQSGVILERLGRSREALSATQRAVELDPTHTRAMIQLARAYSQANRPADAAKWLNQVVGLGHEYADVYYMLGNAHRRLGCVEKAASAYRRALHINRNYEEAREALEALSAGAATAPD